MISRTNIFASLRFLMIFYIVQGHFLQVYTSDPFWLALFKQHNAVVGCFFLLSGFLLALPGAQPASSLKFWPYFKKRVFRIYPVYAVVLLLFTPMFLAVDFHYGATIFEEIKRAVIVLLLVQAWHPDWGLLWNSPTWFLSSLVFCYACFPFLLTRFQGLDKKKLIIVLVSIASPLVFIKVLYSYHNGFFFLEGMTEPKPIPYFNFVRFFPAINLMEFALGMIVALLRNQTKTALSIIKTHIPVITLLVLMGLLLVRIYLPLNDMLTRTLLFMPLFLLFLYSVSFGQAKMLSFFESRIFVFLGDISFSLYCVHGAVGQLFYKKAVKSIFDMPEIPYSFFLASIFLIALMLYYGVEKRLAQAPKSQKSFRKKIVRAVS